MKNLFLILLLFIGLGVSAQYNSSLHTTSNKPYAPNGKPTDARSYFYNTGSFSYRPYVSRAEILSYLNTTASRTGNFPIFMDSASQRWELSFKNGTADGDLVYSNSTSAATDTTSLSNRINQKLNSSDTASLSSRINTKQNTLVSGSTIKTIGGINPLGSGDIPVVNVDITAIAVGQVPKWDGSKFVPRNDSVGSGGSTLQVQEVKRTFLVGAVGSPASGDSIYTDTTFIGKDVRVYRDGERMFESTSSGIEMDTSLGKVTFHPPLFSNERVTVEGVKLLSSSSNTATIEDLLFPTQVGLTNSSGVWSGSVSATYYANYGLSNKKLGAGKDGYIMYRYTASDGGNSILAFNSSNTNQPYTDNPLSPTVHYYEAGVYISSGTIYRINNATAPVSIGQTAAVGDYIRINRTGSVLTLEKSSNGTTWSTIYTYGFSSTADLFININIDRFTGVNKLYTPKGYNLQ